MSQERNQMKEELLLQKCLTLVARIPENHFDAYIIKSMSERISDIVTVTLIDPVSVASLYSDVMNNISVESPYVQGLARMVGQETHIVCTYLKDIKNNLQQLNLEFAQVRYDFNIAISQKQTRKEKLVEFNNTARECLSVVDKHYPGLRQFDNWDMSLSFL